MIEHPAELLLPAAVADCPVHVTPPGIGFPAQGLRGVEVHVHRAATGVVGIEDRQAALFLPGAHHNRLNHPLTGHISHFPEHQQTMVRSAFAHQALVHPVAHHLLHLQDEMGFGKFIGVAVFGVNQMLGQMQDHG